MEKEKGFGIGELLIVLLVATVMSLIFYAITIKKVDQKLANLNTQIYSPTPSYSLLPSLTYSPAPTQTASPRTSDNTGSYTKGGLYIKSNPGIKGTVKKGTALLANVAIPIKPAGTDIGTTVYTDVYGKFSIKLAAGQYVLGPVTEPSSGAVAAAVTLTVREGGFTQADITFSSQPY